MHLGSHRNCVALAWLPEGNSAFILRIVVLGAEAMIDRRSLPKQTSAKMDQKMLCSSVLYAHGTAQGMCTQHNNAMVPRPLIDCRMELLRSAHLPRFNIAAYWPIQLSVRCRVLLRAELGLRILHFGDHGEAGHISSSLLLCDAPHIELKTTMVQSSNPINGQHVDNPFNLCYSH